MAELILTDQEKETLSHLEWSDEAIANAVRRTALAIQDENGMDSILAVSAARVIVSSALTVNADSTTITLDDVTWEDEPVGCWEVTARRLPHSTSNQ